MFHFIQVGFIKDFGFGRIILKCDKDPRTKSIQVAVIQACAGVEVIPHGPITWLTVVWKWLYEK